MFLNGHTIFKKNTFVNSKGSFVNSNGLFINFNISIGSNGGSFN